MYNYRWYTADGMFPGGKNATLLYLKKPTTHNQRTLETKAWHSENNEVQNLLERKERMLNQPNQELLVFFTNVSIFSMVLLAEDLQPKLVCFPKNMQCSMQISWHLDDKA